MLYAGLLFFSFVESIIAVALMSAAFMRFKEPVKKHVIAGITAMLFGITLLFYVLVTKGINAADGFVVLVILAINLAWYLICSWDCFFVSLFNFFTILNVYVAISYIADSFTLHDGKVGSMLAYIAIRTAIYVAIIPLLFKFVRPRFRRLVDVLEKEWQVSTLVPLIFFVLQIVLLYYPVPYWNENRSNWYDLVTVVVYVLFLAVYYLLYTQANAIVEKYNLERRHLLMAQQDKLWEWELERQKSSNALLFQQRHDMHHHNAVIMGMIKIGNFTELEAYMQSYDQAIDASNSKEYCRNTIVNSICNAYAMKAERARIKSQFHTVVPEQAGIENIDLTCVFGNMLENAIEGCLRLEEGCDKFIHITAKHMDGRLRIQVENSCRDDIMFENELPKTQKPKGGTGIQSMIYTVEKYDGNFGFCAENGKFTALIVLNAHPVK